MDGHTVSIDVAAPPQRVWDVLADVTRTGEWSPVCRRVEWLGGASAPAVGARFKGYNRNAQGVRWTRECEITEAERGRVFAFSTYLGERESTRWRYTLETADGGTRLTESYEPLVAPLYVRLLRAVAGSKLDRDARKNIETSIRNLKRVVEAG